jgi:hypothetical protein
MAIDGKQRTDGNGAGGSVLDSNDPMLQPPKEADANRKKKPWKRKLIGWSVILLLIVAGVGALYVLMRVRRVNVTVNADSRRDTQSTKPQTVTNSDSHLTAEAINMARTAAGADANAPLTNSVATVPSSDPSPGPAQDDKVGFTGDSPVFDIGKSGDSGSPQVQLSAPVKSEASSAVQPQSRANPTQSLFVDDPAPKSTPAPAPVRTPLQTSLELKLSTPAIKKVAPPTVPPFGTMLPVRTQGVIFTLRNNSYARLELTRDMAGSGWSLPKGTVLIGRTTGSEHDRAFINVIGYIDPRENKLVTMTGDALGSDGANGIPGKRMKVDRSSLKQTLRKVASGGLQVASSMAGAFTGRGTVVIDGAGYRLMDPSKDQARGLINGSERNTFVKVDAGQQAYVMVIDLPSRVEGADAPGKEEHERFNETSLTDREVMELILFGTAEEVRAAMPLMTHEQKRLVLKAQSQESDRP